MDIIEPIDRTPIEPYRLSIGIDPSHVCDKNEMFVPTSDQGPKKYCCYFCKKLVSKLVPHLENVHKNEKDVKAFKSLPHGKLHFSESDCISYYTSCFIKILSVFISTNIFLARLIIDVIISLHVPDKLPQF